MNQKQSLERIDFILLLHSVKWLYENLFIYMTDWKNVRFANRTKRREKL